MCFPLSHYYTALPLSPLEMDLYQMKQIIVSEKNIIQAVKSLRRVVLMKTKNGQPIFPVKPKCWLEH